MLQEVLQALRMLKQDGNPSQEVNEVIDFLEQSVKMRTRQGLLDLMTVGEVIGYDTLQHDLRELANFLDTMKKERNG